MLGSEKLRDDHLLHGAIAFSKAFARRRSIRLKVSNLWNTRRPPGLGQLTTAHLRKAHRL
jgi:hypothetical protein